MIGLSPLSSGHPLRFQPKWVRPSTGSYPRFSLPKDSSPGFASAACDSRARLKARFRCGSLLSLTSPHTATRWLILQKARRHGISSRSDCLGAHGFRCCFTPLSGCFSPFPHGTGSLSVTGECSALEGGPPGFGPGFTCPDLLGDAPAEAMGFAYGALTRFGRPSQAVPLPHELCDSAGTLGGPPRAPRNPEDANPPGRVRSSVWAGALSLAATRAISVDFSSSGYLDVSVPRVAASRRMRSGGSERA